MLQSGGLSPARGREASCTPDVMIPERGDPAITRLRVQNFPRSDSVHGHLKKDASFPGGLAFICASLSNGGQAFEWLEKSYQERDAFLAFLPTSLNFAVFMAIDAL